MPIRAINDKQYKGVSELYRKSDGEVTGYYITYRDIDGKPIKRRVDADNRGDALRKLTEIKKEIDLQKQGNTMSVILPKTIKDVMIKEKKANKPSNEKDKCVTMTEMNDLKSDMILLRRQLFSDDISNTKNKLWVFKDKLSDHDTFNDFGFLVSTKISDYEAILKEYDSNVGNKLLKLVSDYMIGYMKENHLKFEIVRYMEDNFLIFMHDLNEEDVEEHVVNMQKSMSNYKFKQRNKVFNLTFYFAVMQYVKNESFSSVLDQLDEKLFLD